MEKDAGQTFRGSEGSCFAEDASPDVPEPRCCACVRLSMTVDLIQWPAMVVTIAAAWFVASRSPERRKVGFWLFLVSNVLWIVWGVHSKAYALIALQIGLAFMNIRGERKNASEQSTR